VVERVDGRQRCALLNETLYSAERGAKSTERRPASVGLGDLTDTRLFWIVVMSALSGTCLVLLTVAVAALMRRVCCRVDTARHHHQQQQQRGPHQSSSWRRRHRISGDCACHQSSPLSHLPLADIEQSDDLTPPTRRDASEV